MDPAAGYPPGRGESGCPAALGNLRQARSGWPDAAVWWGRTHGGENVIHRHAGERVNHTILIFDQGFPLSGATWPADLAGA